MQKPNQILRINDSKIGEEIQQTVNSRELWEQLEIKDKYADWIKYQIESLGLEENLDYEVFRKKAKYPQGGRPESDYILTIDSAKHIAMTSRTSKGKEVRKYFIAMEKYAKFHIDKQLLQLKSQDDMHFKIMKCQNWLLNTDTQYKNHIEQLQDNFAVLWQTKNTIDEFLRYANNFADGVENKQAKNLFLSVIDNIKNNHKVSEKYLNAFAQKCLDDLDNFKIDKSRYLSILKQKGATNGIE